MSRTNLWDETYPAGSLAADQLDEAIRKLRLDTREVINQLMGVAEGTALADPVIADGLNNADLDSRIDVFEGSQSLSRSYPALAGQLVIDHYSFDTQSTDASYYTTSPPSVVINYNNNRNGAIYFLLNLPVGVTITRIEVFLSANPAANILFGSVATSTSVMTPTTINSTTATTYSDWNVTDTVTEDGKGYYVSISTVHSTSGHSSTINGIKVHYTSPNANVRT